MDLIEQVKKTNAYACLECGKCTGVCPVSRFSKQYSPRLLLNQSVREEFDQLFQRYDLWSCLTCKRCDEVCISNIQYIELTRILRTQARGSVFQGRCSHSGALELLQRIMIRDDLKQKRLEWVEKDMQVSREKGDVLYFVGCAPYFDAFFTDLELNILDGARSSIRILNRLGITPVVMPAERCCGHDLLWNGDEANFLKLAEHNLAAMTKTGAGTILFSCAECLSAFKNLYPRYGIRIKAELKHMSEFLAEKVGTGALQVQGNGSSVTYQDPCRLGRHLGIYEPPRKVLKAGSNGDFREMRQSQKGALCCGVSAWMNCDGTSKKIQTERLQQAHATGAETLAVACPKCQIHLQCTLKDKHVREAYGLKIKDIATLTLERIV